jgi:septal ring factor EnvC (AmiA/AmiB activator)
VCAYCYLLLLPQQINWARAHLRQLDNYSVQEGTDAINAVARAFRQHVAMSFTPLSNAVAAKVVCGSSGGSPKATAADEVAVMAQAGTDECTATRAPVATDPLQEELGLAKASIGALRKELAAADGTMKPLRQELADAKADTSALQEKVTAADVTIEALQKELAAADGTMKPLRQELADAKADTSALQEKVTAADVTIEALQKELAEAKVNCSALRDETVTANGTLVALQKKVTAADGTNGALQTEVADTEATAEELRQRLTNAEAAVCEVVLDFGERLGARCSLLEEVSVGDIGCIPQSACACDCSILIADGERCQSLLAGTFS